MAANTGKAPKGLKRRNARASVEASACVVQPSEGVAQRAEEACLPTGPALATGLATRWPHPEPQGACSAV